MPQFNLIERQVPETGEAPGVRMDKNTFRPLSQGQSAIAGGLEQASNVALRIQRAKDASDFASAKITYQEGIDVIEDEFQGRGDYENFQKDFDTHLGKLESEILNDKTISRTAQNAIKSSFSEIGRVGRTEVRSLVRRKQIDRMRGQYFVNIDKSRRQGDREASDQLTEQMAAAGVIDTDEAERELAANRELSNFYNAAAAATASPEKADEILEEFPLTIENQDKIRALADKVQNEAQQRVANEANRMTIKELAGPEPDFDKLISMWERLGNENPEGFRSVSIEDSNRMMSYLHTQRDEANNSAMLRDEEHFIAYKMSQIDRGDYVYSKLEADVNEAVKGNGKIKLSPLQGEKILKAARASDLAVEAQGIAIDKEIVALTRKNAELEAKVSMNVIAAQFRKGAIGSLQARQMTLDTLDRYQSSTLPGVASAALSLVDEVSTEIDKRKRALENHADDVFDRFLPGFWSEFVAGMETGKENRERLREMSEEIAQEEDPEKQAALRVRFIESENRRLTLYSKTRDAVEAFIDTNPDAKPIEIEELILVASATLRNEDAMNAAMGPKFISRDTIRRAAKSGLKRFGIGRQESNPPGLFSTENPNAK